MLTLFLVFQLPPVDYEKNRKRLTNYLYYFAFFKNIDVDVGPYCISNIMRKFGCPREDAEDILIDSIINFRDKILAGKVTYLSSIRNYIYTTCVNMKKERDYYAKRQKEKEGEVILYLYSDNEETKSYQEELLQISMQAFRQLSDSCQQILRYFYIYKLSMEQIADELEYSSANTAKVTKARCYKKWLEFVNKDERL